MNVRGIVEQVLASLRLPDEAERPASEPPLVDAEQLASLRELFVSAGAAAVAEQLEPRRWVQVGVEFRDHTQHGRFLYESLPGVIGEWLDAGRIDRCFFMNKAPGCRLRVRPIGAPDEIRERLVALLDAEFAAARVLSHRFGTYEAEVYQFGGPVGMELCHELFTIESRALLEYGHVHAAGRTSVDPMVFSLFVIHALLRRAVGDRWEMWDAWMHMDMTGRRVELDAARRQALREELADQREVLETLALQPELLLDELDGDERPLFQRYLDGVDELAPRLRAAAESGALCFGLRQILPFWIVFHWNRMRFDQALQCTLVSYMTEVLNPKARS